MTPYERQSLRVAVDINRRVTAQASQKQCIDLPEPAWQQCLKLRRLWNRAYQQHWQFAAHQLESRFREAIQHMRRELDGVELQLQSQAAANAQPPTTLDLFRDLAALPEEFDDVAIDRKSQTISATTESIVLDGIHLGPFQIVLEYASDPYGYRIVAREPNPAASNESVTHPHVQDEALCEGDGRAAIREALAQHRFLDFFQIVANVIRTYNVEGPFVALSEWNGIACADCADTVSEEEVVSCEVCSTSVCGGCSGYCSACESSSCNECTGSCEGCSESTCCDCLKSCQLCRESFCPDCLDPLEHCQECHEQTLEEESLASQASTPDVLPKEANPSVHAHSVGEAAIPA